MYVTDRERRTRITNGGPYLMATAIVATLNRQEALILHLEKLVGEQAKLLRNSHERFLVDHPKYKS